MRSVQYLVICAAIALSSSVSAAQAPVKPDAAAALNPDSLTVETCIQILNGLLVIDGTHEVVTNAGKSNEAIAHVPFSFENGGVRLDIADDISALTAVQKAAQEASQKNLLDVSDGLGAIPEVKPDPTIADGGAAFREYMKKNVRLNEMNKQVLAKPCTVTLKHIPTSAFKLDKQEIPSTALSNIRPIRD